MTEIFTSFFPLYGFLIFGIFSLFYHFFTEALEAWHNPVLIAALAYSVITGIIINIQGLKEKSHKNEFQKIMLVDYLGRLI